MATSGTVGTTVITVQNLIDSGARRAGKLAEELTSEQLQMSKQCLYYVLSNLVNLGVHYWCIQKNIIGLNPSTYEYYLPVGTNDVLNSNYRTVTTNTNGGYSSSGVASYAFDGVYTNICQLSNNTGTIGIVLTSAVSIATIGILPAVSGAVTLNLQYSTDNSTWVTLQTQSPTLVANQWVYYDLDPSTTALYWRIQQTSGVNLGVYQVCFGSSPTEIPLYRMNRDDYTNLPNKNFPSNYPLQYWLNRTIPQPIMTLWPTPQIYSPQIVAWCSRYVQDVGALSGSIEVPQRWYLAIQNMLGYQMSMELPQVTEERIMRLSAEADKTWMIAEQEERDKSPIYLAPNISVYTR